MPANKKSSALFDMRFDEMLEQMFSKSSVESKVEIIEQFSSNDYKGQENIRNKLRLPEMNVPEPINMNSFNPKNVVPPLPPFPQIDVGSFKASSKLDVEYLKTSIAPFLATIKAIDDNNNGKYKPILKTTVDRFLRRKKVRFAPFSENKVHPIPHFRNMSDAEINNVWLNDQEFDNICQENDYIVEGLMLGEDINNARGLEYMVDGRYGEWTRRARQAVMNVQEFTKTNAIDEAVDPNERWEMIADIYRVCAQPSVCAAREKALQDYDEIQLKLTNPATTTGRSYMTPKTKKSRIMSRTDNIPKVDFPTKMNEETNTKATSFISNTWATEGSDMQQQGFYTGSRAAPPSICFEEGMFQTDPAAAAVAMSHAVKGSVPDIFLEEGIVGFS